MFRIERTKYFEINKTLWNVNAVFGEHTTVEIQLEPQSRLLGRTKHFWSEPENVWNQNSHHLMDKEVIIGLLLI